MIGQTVSHYRITRKLGEGGMGAVYEATDTRLKRKVALKFLHGDAFGTAADRERFMRESRLAAAVDHPNICTVYEIDEHDGQLFIAMAYIEGQTLREKIQAGPLDIDTAVELAAQLAGGLKAAHERGIVHGDIKSANVMVAADGLTKIMDFGLAKIAGESDQSGDFVVAGSAAYMSPEQAGGGVVDARSDVWSLGVVFYEMLAGRLPFRGEFDAAVVYSILNELPTPLSDTRSEVPKAIERIVSKMLARRPEDRYESAGEVLIELSSVRDAGKPERPWRVRSDGLPSIAVLPFYDLSVEKDQEYFCDGIAEEITNALTKVGGLRVVARTSAFAFKGKDVGSPEIGRQLGVEALLEGSVKKAGSRLRITAALTSVSDGYELWSERYDRELEDIFAIQDDITLAIVDRLKVLLLADSRASLVKRHTVDVDAFNSYWKGRFFWNKRTEEGYRRALSCFRQAIDQDPSYALAHVGVADCYDLLGWYDYLAPGEAFPRAKAAVERALAINDSLAEAHATNGWICINHSWDWDCGEAEYRRALELNPGYATAHQWYAECLSYRARHDEAIEHAKIALDLDPLSIIINNDLGQVLYYARRYGEAIDQLKRTLEMAPRFAIAHFFLAFIYAQEDEYEKAIAESLQAHELSGGGEPLAVAQLGTLYALSGRNQEADECLEKLGALAKTRYVSPFCVALVYMGLGRIDAAFEQLHRAFEAHDHWLETLLVHPVLDSLRSDRRYDALLDKMRLAA